MYLIEILHQTTTNREPPPRSSWLYLIEILHQTTTCNTLSFSLHCCILSKFYIKPQHPWWRQFRRFGCILSKFYIKPQHVGCTTRSNRVVSYRNSTSNHNIHPGLAVPVHVVSYRNSTSNHNQELITEEMAAVVSYRNSTSNHNSISNASSLNVLYLIEILHQTTTIHDRGKRNIRCILSKFYIKPQHSFVCVPPSAVVSYRNSTSNHN
mgnify:CR=1 FL=1